MEFDKDNYFKNPEPRNKENFISKLGFEVF